MMLAELYCFVDALGRKHVVEQLRIEDAFVRIRFRCPRGVSWKCDHSRETETFVLAADLAEIKPTDLLAQVMRGVESDQRSRCELCSAPVRFARIAGATELTPFDDAPIPGGPFELRGDVARNIGTQIGESGHDLHGYRSHLLSCKGVVA